MGLENESFRYCILVWKEALRNLSFSTSVSSSEHEAAFFHGQETWDFTSTETIEAY